MMQRNKTVLWRELDGEAVLLDPAAGCSYNLNRVGTVIWKLLDGTHAAQEIAQEVCQLYEVEYDQALEDVETILNDLKDHNLVLNGFSAIS